jgi:hypothetical protein
VTLARYAMWATGVVVGPLAIFAAFPGSADPLTVRSAAYGAGLSALNTIVAYALVLWSQGRSTRAFMSAVLGGMLGRMAFLLGAVVVGIGVLELSRIPLVIALLSYFVLFLVLELGVLHRQPTAEAR